MRFCTKTKRDAAGGSTTLLFSGLLLSRPSRSFCASRSASCVRARVRTRMCAPPVAAADAARRRWNGGRAFWGAIGLPKMMMMMLPPPSLKKNLPRANLACFFLHTLCAAEMPALADRRLAPLPHTKTLDTLTSYAAARLRALEPLLLSHLLLLAPPPRSPPASPFLWHVGGGGRRTGKNRGERMLALFLHPLPPP